MPEWVKIILGILLILAFVYFVLPTLLGLGSLVIMGGIVVLCVVIGFFCLKACVGSIFGFEEVQYLLQTIPFMLS